MGTAIENDAKEYGAGWKLGVYQLVVWGDNLLKQKAEIERKIKELFDRASPRFAFLNLIDVESKKSHIFIVGNDGQEILSKALDTNFNQGWAELPQALLRKQIMPKVNEFL